MKKFKNIYILIPIVIIILLIFITPAAISSKKPADNYEDFEKTMSKYSYFNKEEFSYIADAVGRDEMNSAIEKYKKAYPDKPYRLFNDKLKSIYMEASANNFSNEQIKAIFISEINLVTDNAVKSKMDFSPTPPDCAPSHQCEAEFDDN